MSPVVPGRWSSLTAAAAAVVPCRDETELRRRRHGRSLLKRLGDELGVETQADWYAMSTERVLVREGGAGLLHRHGGSLQRALADLLPEQCWQPWLFEHVSVGFWESATNRQRYIEWLEQQLAIASKDQWYRVTIEQIRRLGGSGFLNGYDSSIQRALADIYPDYPWRSWLFAHGSRGIWSCQANVDEFLGWVERQLYLASEDHWYEISHEQLTRLGGKHFVDGDGFTTLVQVLQRRYPHRRWQRERFFATPAKTQRLIYRMLHSLLPYRTDIELNSSYHYHYHHQQQQQAQPQPHLHVPFFLEDNNGIPQEPKVILSQEKMSSSSSCSSSDLSTSRSTTTGNSMVSLDVYLPSLSLAIEYHGMQHFEHTDFFGSPERQQVLDEEKRQLCTRAGITLVEIGYWWNFDKNSLIAAIDRQRPDLFVDHHHHDHHRPPPPPWPTAGAVEQ